jgi:hypothetical protein
VIAVALFGNDLAMISQQKKIVALVIALALALGIWWWRSSGEPETRADARSDDASSTGGSELAPPSLGGNPGLAERIRDAIARRAGGGEPAIPAGSARVHGVVKDPSGARVSFVDVLFRSRLGESSATSDGSGEFEIELSSGIYELHAIGDRLISRAAPSLRVLPLGPGDPPQQVEVVVERLATLAGRVVQHNGSAAGDATVHTIATSAVERSMGRGGLLLDQVAAESDGSFSIDALAKKELVLEARSGHVRARLVLRDVKPGETRDGLVIELAEAIEISGVVADPSGRMVSGAQVSLVVNAGNMSHSQKVETDSAGRFTFEPMTRGGFVLEARADGYGPSPLLTVPPAEVGRGAQSFTLNLQPGNVVAGTVVDEEGNPLHGVRLRIGRGGSSFKALERYTGDRGEFTITGVDRAKHWLSAVKGGYATTTVEGLEPPRRDLEIVMVPFGSIRGRVTGGGQPLSSFVVRIDQVKQRGVSASRPGERSTRFSGGSYELVDLEPGRYDLTISSGGFQPVKVSVEVPPGKAGDGSAALAAVQ